MRNSGLTLLVALAAAAALTAAPLRAAYPGAAGRIVVVSVLHEHDLFALGDASRVTRLTKELADERDPALAPDRRTIVFASNRYGDTELELIALDGSGRRRLTTSPGADTDPAWSPDGSRIAWVAARDGRRDLYTMRIDGGVPVRVTATAADEEEPAWAPDGARLAFARGGDIYVVSVDGSGERRVTARRAAPRVTAPRWSPDGTRLVFWAPLSAMSFRTPDELGVVDVDGTGERLLGVGLPRLHKRAPVWSPSGRIVFVANETLYAVDPSGGSATRVSPPHAVADDWDGDERVAVFARDVAPHDQLYDVDPDGTGLRRLTDASAVQPAYSPDGTRIAFVSEGRAGRRIMVLPAAGGPSRLVATGSAQLGITGLTWSPDGRRIAAEERRGIVVVDVATGRKRLLHGTRREDGEPAWSPRGGVIAFRRQRGVTPEIWLVRARGGGARLLRRNAQQPDWAPNGRSLAFVNGWVPSYNLDIWTMRADGRRARRLTRAERFELRPRWSPDGRWIAFVSDAADDDVERAVYVMPARGGPRRRVVAGGFDGFSWQPVRR